MYKINYIMILGEGNETNYGVIKFSIRTNDSSIAYNMNIKRLKTINNNTPQTQKPSYIR